MDANLSAGQHFLSTREPGKIIKYFCVIKSVSGKHTRGEIIEQLAVCKRPVNLETKSAFRSSSINCEVAGINRVYQESEIFFEKSGFGAFKVSDKKPAGIAAPIVMHIASLQANLALRYLAGLSVKKDMLYYLFINEEGELITQKLAMPTV